MPLDLDLQVSGLGLVAEDVGQALAILQFHAGPELQGLDRRLVEDVPDSPRPPPGPARPARRKCACLSAWEGSVRSPEWEVRSWYASSHGKSPQTRRGESPRVAIYPKCRLDCQDESMCQSVTDAAIPGGFRVPNMRFMPHALGVWPMTDLAVLWATKFSDVRVAPVLPMVSTETVVALLTACADLRFVSKERQLSRNPPDVPVSPCLTPRVPAR